MLRIGPCPISQAVAVGGGGTPSVNTYEGAGSGYVTFAELTPTKSFLRYEAAIGSSDNPTNVTNVGSGEVVLEAQPGRGGVLFLFNIIPFSAPFKIDSRVTHLVVEKLLLTSK